MYIIEPHIHMFSRTTDDYQRMYANNIRVVVEPSFWLGVNRKYAQSFFDYFSIILEFENIRARRFGIDHWAFISINPKESDNLALAKEVIAGLSEYMNHPRCLGIGEIGFNNITKNEEKAFLEQLELAKRYDMLVIIHTPHNEKPKGTKRIVEILKSFDIELSKIVIDHNTEETMPITKQLEGVWAGMTVYPISKLNPQRVAGILKKYGIERMLVNSSADWGVSDPLSLIKVKDELIKESFSQEQIQQLLFHNPMNFLSQSKKFKPDLNIKPLDIREFQR